MRIKNGSGMAQIQLIYLPGFVITVLYFTGITSHRDKDNIVNERENWVMKIREAMALFILKHSFLKNMTVRKEKRNSEETIINGVKKNRKYVKKNI